MNIGAIGTNSISSLYSTSTEYKYFGTTISSDRLQDLMERYGIIQTGDSETDLRALYQAMMGDAVSELKNAQTATNTRSKVGEPSQLTQAQNASNVPWATLMGQIGLSVTGDFATDYQAFNSKISVMNASATTPQDKASINQLVAQATVVFIQPSQSTAQASSLQPQGQNSQPQFTGADIQAQLNRLFLVTG